MTTQWNTLWPVVQSRNSPLLQEGATSHPALAAIRGCIAFPAYALPLKNLTASHLQMAEASKAVELALTQLAFDLVVQI